MSFLRFSSKQLVVVNFADIFIFNITEGTVRHLKNKRWILPKDELAKQNDCGSLKIQTANFSPCGKYFAYSDDYKQLVLYRAGEEWVHIGTASVVKRAMALVFTESEDKIIVADKSGDVYNFNVEDVQNVNSEKIASESQSSRNPLMGHLSSVLDVVFTESSKFLITCDRDEKIRVSCYPNLYNIHAYCLGHSQYVVKLLYLKGRKVLLSTSGDGSVRCWDVSNGKQLACHQIQESDKNTADENTEVRKSSLIHCPQEDIIVFSSRNLQELHVLKLVDGDITIQLKSLHTIPLDCHALDVTFDSNGRLWVLKQNTDQPVVIYSYDKMNLRYELDEQFELCNEFKGLVTQSMIANPVDSAEFNPVKRWEQSTEEYIASKGSKRKNELETSCVGDLKKAK